MNSSINSLFYDIFSNEHDLDFFLNCIEKEKCDIKDKECKSEPWLKRLEQFYDDFLKTEEGLMFKKWLPTDYDKRSFIEEYMKWFCFFHYFQRKMKNVGNRILFKRLLFFQTLFLTKPFIFYIKRVLKLHYFYTYFVDLSRPKVYSLFKELEEFTCYFPWYSGFTILDKYDLRSGIDKSNDHMQQYINNLIEYKELYDIPDPDKLHLHRFVRFINFSDNIDSEIEHRELKKNLTDQIKNKIKAGEVLKLMDMKGLNCQKASPFSRSKYSGRIPIKDDLLVSICVNFCLQDILDKIVEDLREQDLPEIKSQFTIEKFDVIQRQNPYMKRFRENNYEDGYYFSPQMDLFALNKILEDLKKMNLETKKTVLRDLFQYFVKNNQDDNRNNIINFLYKNHKSTLKTSTNTLNISNLLKVIKDKEALSPKDVEDNQEWEKIKKFLRDNKILYKVNENFGDLFTHFAFRKNIPGQFSNFDYSFIGLKLSNLRYILKKIREYTDSSLMFYEIHQIAAFMPLEDYDEKVARERLRKTKNFFSSIIYIFATRIVTDKMSHFVEQKTTSDVTSRWAHALKTRIEFLKPIAQSLKEKFLDIELQDKKAGRNIVNILENRVKELSNIASLIYELSKDRISNYDILKGFEEFVTKYKENPESYSRRHLVEIIQESINTALVRIITDDVYSTYIAARRKCIKPEYITNMTVPKSKLSSRTNTMEIVESEDQGRLIFGDSGLSNVDRATMETFLEGIYKITTLGGTLDAEYDSDVRKNLNYFILEESKIREGETDKRFPMATMISMMLDEVLLNALKYFDCNKDGNRYVKIIIERPKMGFSTFNIGNGYILPVTIINSISPETMEEHIQRDLRKYRTGLQLIEMGLSLLQEESRDNWFKIENGKFFEFKVNIPVYLSGSNWTLEHKSKGGNKK
jgi:two-component sensor histidine kinase